MMDTTNIDKRTKRNSMLAYVPVHRRNDVSDSGQQRSNQQQQQRYSTADDQGNKRSSFNQKMNGSNGARYSSDISSNGNGIGNDSKSMQRYSQQQQQQQGWRKGQNNVNGGGSVEQDDYLEESNIHFNSTNNHRYSSNSHRTSMSSFDPRMSMLDSLPHDDHRQSTGPEDWNELLRQYDRPDEEAAILTRKNKRASRIMDPFNEPPTQVPVVGEPTVVLDCRDFPKSFKTHHLHDIFREYENIRGGYRIKWIDDTRALIIFEHPATAKKAYINNVSNAYAKIRPYEGPADILSGPAPQMNRRSASYNMKRQSGTISEPLK
ncbi:hypothetical protein BCR42DRAFT_408461 [Absidia repens]|uniref:Thc1 RRM domain-containing protein n=1 Tax=Absidia repens TaxID=90262 RepID=A0A1X2IPV8_9FUNG|nr:hypothetical protein BCR42DRAFT_408461 [Absidia repens]